jgi:hypothetical protein
MSRGIVDLADYRVMGQITRLCELGEPRILTELVLEIGAITSTRTEVELIVTKYDVAFCTRKPRR